MVFDPFEETVALKNSVVEKVLLSIHLVVCASLLGYGLGSKDKYFYFVKLLH